MNKIICLLITIIILSASCSKKKEKETCNLETIKLEVGFFNKCLPSFVYCGIATDKVFSIAKYQGPNIFYPIKTKLLTICTHYLYHLNEGKSHLVTYEIIKVTPDYLELKKIKRREKM